MDFEDYLANFRSEQFLVFKHLNHDRHHFSDSSAVLAIFPIHFCEESSYGDRQIIKPHAQYAHEVNWILVLRHVQSHISV